MQALEALDPLVTELAKRLYTSVDIQDWESARFEPRFVPSGDTGSMRCVLVGAGGKMVEGWYPSDDALDRMYELARAHWLRSQELGQPRWYQMTVAVQRSGKFSVDFQYKDDYREGDIMERG